jgi:hypothetical protein
MEVKISTGDKPQPRLFANVPTEREIAIEDDNS